MLASSKMREASKQHRGQNVSKSQESGRFKVNEHYFLGQYSVFRFWIKRRKISYFRADFEKSIIKTNCQTIGFIYTCGL